MVWKRMHRRMQCAVWSYGSFSGSYMSHGVRSRYVGRLVRDPVGHVERGTRTQSSLFVRGRHEMVWKKMDSAGKPMMIARFVDFGADPGSSKRMRCFSRFKNWDNHDSTIGSGSSIGNPRPRGRQADSLVRHDPERSNRHLLHPYPRLRRRLLHRCPVALPDAFPSLTLFQVVGDCVEADSLA